MIKLAGLIRTIILMVIASLGFYLTLNSIQHFTTSAYPITLSLIAGISLAVTAQILFDLYLQKYHNLTKINVSDFAWFNDKPLHRSNFIGAIPFERMDYDQMKDYFYNKISIYDKLRSKVVEKYGGFYWERMCDDELRLKWDTVC